MNRTAGIFSALIWRHTLMIFPVILASLVVSACAVSEHKPEVFADYDPGTSFSGYHSFAWSSADPVFVSSTRPVAPRTREILMQETVAQLKAKGFTQVQTAADADLLVSIVIGSRDDVQVNSYRNRWGGGYSEVRETTDFGIGIELFNRESEQRLWTGWATAGLTMETYANSEKIVKELVDMILNLFPPDRAASMHQPERALATVAH